MTNQTSGVGSVADFCAYKKRKDAERSLARIILFGDDAERREYELCILKEEAARTGGQVYVAENIPDFNALARERAYDVAVLSPFELAKVTAEKQSLQGFIDEISQQRLGETLLYLAGARTQRGSEKRKTRVIVADAYWQQDTTGFEEGRHFSHFLIPPYQTEELLSLIR